MALLLEAATIGRWQADQKSYFVGQIAPFTLKFLRAPSTKIELQGGYNIRYVASTALGELPPYAQRRYYFKILAPNFRLPDAIVRTATYTSRVRGTKMEAKRLKAPQNFCSVLAKELKLIEYEAVQYNRSLNLLVLKLEATLANLKDFTIPQAKKSGIKKYSEHFPKATLIYYAMLPKEISKLELSYFDVVKKEFRPLRITIDVPDESVSTQSDIRPTEDKNKKIKIVLFGSLAGVLLILFLIKRSWIALLFGIAALLYTAYLLIPIKRVCVKSGAKIYILPTKQSTIFSINHQSKIYEQLNRVGDYVKIKLSNEKIGWVKNEDLCQN